MALRSNRGVAAAATVVVTLAISFGCASQLERKPFQTAAGDPPYDILIRGGRVVDGTGAPWFYADVGVRGGRIAAIGKLQEHAATEVIDATGSVVTPGFIDMHSHSDLALLKDGRGLSKIRQGVTTEVIGEGVSVAPRRKDAKDGKFGIKPDWTTLREYFQRLQASGTGSRPS